MHHEAQYRTENDGLKQWGRHAEEVEGAEVATAAVYPALHPLNLSLSDGSAHSTETAPVPPAALQTIDSQFHQVSLAIAKFRSNRKAVSDVSTILFLPPQPLIQRLPPPPWRCSWTVWAAGALFAFPMRSRPPRLSIRRSIVDPTARCVFPPGSVQRSLRSPSRARFGSLWRATGTVYCWRPTWAPSSQQLPGASIRACGGRLRRVGDVQGSEDMQ